MRQIVAMIRPPGEAKVADRVQPKNYTYAQPLASATVEGPTADHHCESGWNILFESLY